MVAGKCTMPSVEAGQTAILATHFGKLETFMDDHNTSNVIVQQHASNGTVTSILELFRNTSSSKILGDLKVPRFMVVAPPENLTLVLPDVGKSDEGTYLFKFNGPEEIRYACNFTLATPIPCLPPAIPCTTPTSSTWLPTTSSTWLPTTSSTWLPTPCGDEWKNATIALALMLVFLLFGIGTILWYRHDRCRNWTCPEKQRPEQAAMVFRRRGMI